MKKKLFVILAGVLVVGTVIISTNIVFAKNDFTKTSESAEISKSVTEDHVSVEFYPAKRIEGNIKEVRNQVKNERSNKVREIIIQKYGFDPENNALTSEQEYQMIFETGEYDNALLTEIFKKISRDGYGSEKYIFNGEDFTSEEHIVRYCDLIKMTCNAYNDPDYSLTDFERMIILDFIENSVLTLNMYISEHGDNTPKEVYETHDYESNTFTKECGYKPLEGTSADL